ncbi:3-oxoacyl-reductase [Gonapodya prolifera JEL478]|uniref:3-oxoacyl-reductase n=1 Tax=Gonapodya prolifera (strain JEL478) TaxID=1344416 RepID=A0A139AYF9_GONPJ|nr:3-oxoacyl-reductase [Gonapodya prolifera JEL478]|eukprot:KXS21788.1 3-oxoacyl-reductase [Gonapodya prolifera JEL478]
MADRVGLVANHLGAFPNGILAGQVAIITGSGQGIGRASALLFAKEGASVVVTDIDKTKSDAVAQEIKDAGGKAISFPGDVTDPKFPEGIVKATVAAFGKLNIVINNAGFTFDGMIHKMTDAQWNLMLTVHNTAPFRLIRAAAEEFRKNNGEPRAIVNISSTSGIHGNVGQVNYATAKAGVNGMTKTIAKEWGPLGVRANSIAFGLVDTRLTRAKEAGEAIVVDGQKVSLGVPERMRAAGGRGYEYIPLRRAGTPEDAAGAVLFLASPLASYVTGHCLEVTGGVGI